MTIRGRGLLVLALMAATVAPPAWAEGKTISITPHRALYDVTLRNAKSSAGIADIHGQMFYNLEASCSAWTTTHRFVLLYDYIDSAPSQVVSEFTTTESRDGRKFEFKSRRVKDGEVQEEIAGQAVRPSKPGKTFQARITSPDDTAPIPLEAETLFPIAHSIGIIESAMAGQKFIRGQIFDGSDTDGPYHVSGLILKPISEPERKREWPKAVDKKLASQPGWRTQVAIFPDSQKNQSASDYEMDVNMLQDGIVTDMAIRYSDFTIDQSLKALTANPEPECNPDGTPVAPPPAEKPEKKKS